MTEPIPAWPGEFVSLGDGEVFVRTAAVGDGAEPAALFVHGFGGSSTNWTDLMHLLSTSGEGAGVACDALDLPGFGYSPPAEGSCTVNGQAASGRPSSRPSSAGCSPGSRMLTGNEPRPVPVV